MKYIIIVICVFILSCSSNKVVKKHGTSSLENKSKKIVISKSNKNDVIDLLGPPSTKSSFDEKALVENIRSIYETLIKARPASVKGTYLKKISVSSTMGPGIKIDQGSID